jgi:hypothetical protein
MTTFPRAWYEALDRIGLMTAAVVAGLSALVQAVSVVIPACFKVILRTLKAVDVHTETGDLGIIGAICLITCPSGHSATVSLLTNLTTTEHAFLV